MPARQTNHFCLSRWCFIVLFIYFYVPESTQGHSYKGVFYDRNQDGDFELRSTEQIANFIRKSKLKTEDRVYPMLGMKDLDEEALLLGQS